MLGYLCFFICSKFGALLSQECQNVEINSGRSYYNEMVNISYCLFGRFSLFSGNGGVINIANNNFHIYVYYSVFYSSSCSGDGGAIHSYASSSNIRFVCASSCHANSYGYHFAILNANSQNNVEYLSMTKCSYLSTKSESIRMDSGNQINTYSNISLNSAERWSSFDNFAAATQQTKFCSHIRNDASGIVSLEAGNGNMEYCNIIGNNSPNGYGVVRAYSGSPTFRYSIFYENTNTLFCGDAGTIIIEHSYISHTGTQDYGSVMSSNNNTFIHQNSYQVSYFQTIYCHADHPVNQAQISPKYSQFIRFPISFLFVVSEFYTIM